MCTRVLTLLTLGTSEGEAFSLSLSLSNSASHSLADILLPQLSLSPGDRGLLLATSP